MDSNYINWTQPIQKHKNHLPHWQQPDCWQFVTWSLGDAISLSARQKLNFEKDIWLKTHPKPWTPEIEKDYYESFEGRVQKWLDAGIGSCLLRNRNIRLQLENNLKYGNGTQYILDAFVVMPNHVHMVLMPINDHHLADIMQGIKSSSSHQINHAHQRKGKLWMEDYWDRMIRDTTHHMRVRRYIKRNPEKAKLRPDEYSLWEKDSGAEAKDTGPGAKDTGPGAPPPP